MALATIRTAMQTAIAGVSNVGVVTPYEPLARRKEDFLRFFKASSLAYMLGWTISRETTEEMRSSDRSNLVTHGMVVRGYRVIGPDGATEEAFQELIEAVRLVMRQNQRTLYGGVAIRVEPPQVRIVEPRDFSGYLVHYCELTQRCAEQLVVVPS